MLNRSFFIVASSSTNQSLRSACSKSLVRAYALAAMVLAPLMHAYAAPGLWVDSDFTPSLYKEIFVASVINDSGKSPDFDATAILREHLISKLKQKRLAVIDEQKGNGLILLARLTLYEPGSALARWVQPGLGATKAVLRATVMDGHTGEIVGDMVVSKYVGAGGLFSAGADKKVLDQLAEDVASALSQRLSTEFRDR